MLRHDMAEILLYTTVNNNINNNNYQCKQLI